MLSPSSLARPRRAWRAVLAVAVLSLAVAGCDSGRSSAPVASSSARASTAGSAARSAVPTTAAGGPGGSASAPAAGGSGGSPPAPAAGPFDPARVAVTVEPVVDGLESPLAVTHAGDGTNRLFVAQQGGQIRIVRDGVLAPEPFLDISDRISQGGERGLLGVAFHPDYPSDPRVFVNYTDRQGDTQVSSFRVPAETPDRADPASEQRLLSVKQPFANHNGGALAFGLDGFLVVALGDGGGAGDPQGNGQNLRTHLGKILRIDVDTTSGDRAYGIPADNPWAAGQDGNLPEIWLTGLRNPWRLSVDRATGDLWIGDVGQDKWEEIDVQRAGEPGGTNFGWNRTEGNHCFRDSCDDAGLRVPVTEYGREGGCTVIGGYVYRGTAQAALAGGYLFGDYCTGRLWAIDPSTDGFRAPTVVGEMGGGLTSFGEDEAGEIYATDIAGGRLLRVIARGR